MWSNIVQRYKRAFGFQEIKKNKGQVSPVLLDFVFSESFLALKEPPKNREYEMKIYRREYDPLVKEGKKCTGFSFL